MNATSRIARDLYADAALAWAAKQPVCRFGIGPSLAGLLAALADYNAEILEGVFFELCIAGRWPGSKSKRSRFGA